MAAKGTLVNAFRNPRDGPHLSVMGMSAELEVNMVLLGLFQMIGLVVQ